MTNEHTLNESGYPFFIYYCTYGNIIKRFLKSKTKR
jgi:hypothetical protein